MTKKESRTTITISRAHYVALQELGKKTDTFNDIIGNLLKIAKERKI
jgi:predicted CopG family antitoxin